MRTAIGFNTTSKKEAQKELDKGYTEGFKNQAQAKFIGLNNIICSDEFGAYTVEYRQQILREFAQISVVVGSF